MVLIASLIKCSPFEEISIAAAGGLASHLCFLIYGEHHMKTPFIFRPHDVLFAVLMYVKIPVKYQNVFPGSKQVFEVSTVYILSLLTSNLYTIHTEGRVAYGVDVTHTTLKWTLCGTAKILYDS